MLIFASASHKKPTELTYDEAVAQVNKWINIRNESESESIIEIDGFIGDDWYGEGENTIKAIKQKLKDISELGSSKIIVNISSLGGSVNHGLGIHDVLAAHKATIITDVKGFTASMGTVIAQAGDERRMSDNALYLIHQPWGMFISNITELEQNVEDMKAINGRLVNIYTKRSGVSEAEIRELMDEQNGNGKWIDSDEALTMGLIDEIYEPMKAAAGPRSIIPEAHAHMRLPDLPQAKEPKAEGESEENTQIIDIMKKKLQDAIDGLMSWLSENFKKEGTDESEVPQEVQDKLTEMQAQIEEAGKQEDTITTLTAQVATLTGEKETNATALETANASIKTLETDLAKANGASTKPTGKTGLEDAEGMDDALQASLAADLAGIKGEL